MSVRKFSGGNTDAAWAASSGAETNHSSIHVFPKVLAALLAAFLAQSSLVAEETFVGSFAEPRDGGNLDTAFSSYDGATVVIVPRSHASEAIGGAIRWRNVLFAIRGMKGKSPVFCLPLTSPGTEKTILSGDPVSFQNIKLVWSYTANTTKWNAFDTITRSGSTSWTWKIEAKNAAPFTQDEVYVSINEHFPVTDFYEWLETEVLTNPFVFPTASEVAAGTFVIGYESGAPASNACSRSVPDMPLFAFLIKDPAVHPTKLVMLVSGQHPYEGQNKAALQGAIDWILHSTSAEAEAYRAQYVTLVYPFVNPTGELAGLWRGTAYQPSRDTNRNWQTTETVPSKDRGIDTVIVHKNAMNKDIAAIGLGEPYASFDYHQNFGDHPGLPDYILHATYSPSSGDPIARQAALTDFAPYFLRISAMTGIADMPSDLPTQETLRGYMVARGVKLPLTFERSVYNTIASESEFGIATVRALVEPSAPVLSAAPTATPASAPVQTVQQPLQSRPEARPINSPATAT